MAKFSKGGVMMIYSTEDAEEGGAEDPNAVTSVPQADAKSLKDDHFHDNIRLSDLPENYFDDLLDLDSGSDSDQRSPESEKRNEAAGIIYILG
jgi:hypothetical protein